MIYQLYSTLTVPQIDQALRASAARHKFGILAVHDLQQTMKNKGVDLKTPCLVYEVCNPQSAKQVIDADGALSAALPCRISVYEAQDGMHLATILPTAMMRMFDSPGLQSVAQEVENGIVEMMQDAS